MKKKTALISVLILFAFFLGGLYFYYQNFLLKDEYFFYIDNFVNAGYPEIQNEGKAVLNIVNYNDSNCSIDYCVLNSCENSITLPCSKKRTNDYTEAGNYELTLNFKKHPLFPLSNARRLVSWDIKEIDIDNSEKTQDTYLNGIKDVIDNHYIWEAFSVIVTDKTEPPQSWIYNSTPTLSFEYLKSVYMLDLLAKKIDDKQLDKVITDEIEYLNDNKDEILSKRYSYANPYILKLVDLGLDEEYLTIYDRFTYLDTNNVEFVSVYLSTDENNSNLSQYYNLLKYAEAANIFKSYGYDELSQFYLSNRNEEYNSTNLEIMGLCTLSNLGFNDIDNEKLLEGLKEEYSKDSSPLFLNLYESIQCKKFVEMSYSGEEDLTGKIMSKINNSSISLDDKSFLIQTDNLLSSESNDNQVTIKYNLLDNIEYVYE